MSANNKITNSRRLAIAIVAITTVLTAFAIGKELEGIAIAIWSTGIPSAIGLYINKQYQDRKWAEIK